jgi:hypothetical protein
MRTLYAAIHDLRFTLMGMQIVPGSSNNLAVDLLVSHVKQQLDSRSLRFRRMLAELGEDLHHSPYGDDADAKSFDDRLVLLSQTSQLIVSSVCLGRYDLLTAGRVF